MKFKGEPNLFVNIDKRHRIDVKGIKFDGNGEYETENEKLIKLFSLHFERLEEMKHCKKCDFKTDNQGDLLAHYRKEHPKEQR